MISKKRVANSEEKMLDVTTKYSNNQKGKK